MRTITILVTNESTVVQAKGFNIPELIGHLQMALYGTLASQHAGTVDIESLGKDSKLPDTDNDKPNGPGLGS